MEKRQNYSRKREAILQTLRSTKLHPTAEWVYQSLKSDYPDLSLGTVYRNLSQFKNDGVIISVGVVNGQERFDADTAPHTHFICSSCGAVIDIPGEFVSDDAAKMVEQSCQSQVSGSEVLFRGICKDCLQKH